MRTADNGSEGECAVGLLGAAADHSLAFKGCTLSQYTSAYDSCGSEVSQVVTVGRSASRGLQTTHNPSSSPFSSLFTRQRSIQSTTLLQISLHSQVTFGRMESVSVVLPRQIQMYSHNVELAVTAAEIQSHSITIACIKTPKITAR